MSVSFNGKCGYDVNYDLVKELSSKLDCKDELSRLLISRGVCDVQAARKFLNPSINDLSDPLKIAGMAAARDRIYEAIAKDESVVIYGDYDCDGVCAIAILYLYLQNKISKLNFYIPNRHEDGYGLHNITVDDVIEKFNPDLMITVDCGITSASEVEYLKGKGVDIIVTDHHEPQTELPACITVDPKVQKEGFYDFCGAGLAFKLIEALAGREEAMRFVGIAALATIADIVPLVNENRVIAKLGLNKLNAGDALVSRLCKKRFATDKFTACDVMFKIAPRINAAGRLGDAGKTLDLFFSSDENALRELFDEIDDDNKRRQELSEFTVSSALEKLKTYDLIDNPAIIMKDERWDSGILGIAAARLADMFLRPVLLFAEKNGVLKGSARSYNGINIFECLMRFENLFQSFGGHSAAAGVTMSADNFDIFVDGVNAYLRKNVSKEQFYPDIRYDLEIKPEDCTLELVEQLEKLEPCGFGNPQPVFMFRGVNLVFNQISQTQHVKCTINNLDLIGFNNLDLLESLRCKNDITFTMSNKVFRNRRYVQGIIKNLHVAEMNNIDEEYVAASYLRQRLCKNRTLKRPIKPFSEDVLNGDSLYGTLYVAFCTDTFFKFIRSFEQKNKFVLKSICRGISINPFNRVVLALDSSYDISYYKNIVLLDKPLTDDYYAFLQSRSDADIYVIDNGCVNIDSAKRFMCVSDDEYRAVYKAIRPYKSIKITSLRKFGETLRDAGYNFGFFKLASTVFILIELGIVKIDDDLNIVFENGVKTSLDKSRIYNALKKIRD